MSEFDEQDHGDEVKETEEEESLDLVTALKSKDVETVYEVLQGVDNALTGSGTAESVEQHVKDDLQQAIEDLKEGYGAHMKYYLGDGGYSRLFINSYGGFDEIEISIGERNATDRVKERWAEIKDQVAPPKESEE